MPGLLVAGNQVFPHYGAAIEEITPNSKFLKEDKIFKQVYTNLRIFFTFGIYIRLILQSY
jgi:hypothetical protein